MSKRPFPKVLRIEPSSECNLKCTHCLTGTDERAKVGLMDESTFKLLFEEVKNYTELETIVFYHGGEPLLNRNIYKWIKRFKEYNSKLFIKL